MPCTPWKTEPLPGKALLRSCLRDEYQAALRGPDQNEKLQRFSQRLLELAA